MESLAAVQPKRWYKKVWLWAIVVIFASLVFFMWQVLIEFHKIELQKNNLINSNATSSLMIEPQNPSTGPANAILQVVEFADFSCPFCEQEFGPLRQFVAAHPADVRLVFRHFPLDDVHPRARPAAIASWCAQQQGKFWPYHDKLYLNQGHHEDSDLQNYALQVGLNVSVWQKCLASPQAAAAVEHDFQAGAQAGVKATPTFFINGHMVKGVIPLSEWESILTQFLGH
jgi:protein-disulfide isomerase